MTDTERLIYLRGLFGQFSNMLSADAWEQGDTPPTMMALSSFFMFLDLADIQRPGLGCGGRGDVIGTWRSETARVHVSFTADGTSEWMASIRHGAIRDHYHSDNSNTATLFRIIAEHFPAPRRGGE